MNTKKIFNMKKIFSISLIFGMIFAQNQLCVGAFWFISPKTKINDMPRKLDYVNIAWWNNFTDPCLKKYIIKALENNEDLKVATLKTDEYMQFIKESFGKELPELATGSNYAGFKLPFSKDKPLNLSDSGYVLPFTVKYEADLLLKNHDKTKSAKKQYESQVWQEKAAYISIASYVATVYVNILKTDKLIELQCDYAAVKKEQLRRMELKHSRGVASSIDVNNYKDAYKVALNNLDSSKKSRDILLHQFCVLIGDTPNNANCIERGRLDDLNFCGVMPDCVPSDVIFARPDVESIEAQLQASKIDVRVARKELFPSFNVYGLLGFNTFTTDPFFSWSGALAYLTAGATQTLFAGGRKIANLRLKKNLYEQMFENYRQTNLKAVQEVNDGLRSVKIDTDVDNQNLNRQKIEENTFIRMSKKYDRGVISTPDLLSEQERLINIQTEKVNSKATRFVNYLSLYKAVGGKL